MRSLRLDQNSDLECCKSAPAYKQIHERTCWRDGRQIPDLGLNAMKTHEFRVYVLQCSPSQGDWGPYLYVGIAHKSNIGHRIAVEMEQRRTSGPTGDDYCADFCLKHKPTKVLFVWPAPNRAVECYVFNALLALHTDRGRIHSLGGWTQTSVNPAPLAVQQFEQARRLLRNRCFNCGSGHKARDCKKPVEGCRCVCPQCKTEIVISSRGQTQVTTASTVTSCGGASVARPPPAVPAPETRAKRPRTASSSAAATATEVARSVTPPPSATHKGKVVLIGGKHYTTLSWYMGADPSRQVCKEVRLECADNAVEMSGGVHCTLYEQGYARQPCESLTSLFRDRTQQPSDEFEPTVVPTATGYLQLRSAGGRMDVTNRQALWLATDLEAYFLQRRPRP